MNDHLVEIKDAHDGYVHLQHRLVDLLNLEEGVLDADFEDGKLTVAKELKPQYANLQLDIERRKDAFWMELPENFDTSRKVVVVKGCGEFWVYPGEEFYERVM